MSINHSEAESALNLRSSGSNPGSDPGQGPGPGSVEMSRVSGVAETGYNQSSQQVMTAVSFPEQLQQPHSYDPNKPGLELTGPPESGSHPGVQLPSSEFVSGGSSDRMPDNVVLEKQKAQEQFYSSGGSNMSLGQVASGGSCHSQESTSPQPCRSDDFKQYPVQDQGSFNEACDSLKKPTDHRDSGPSSTWSTESNISGGNSFMTSASRGPQPASVVHSSPNIPWDENPELVVRSEEYPEHFKEGQYDCVLIYSENPRDIKMAVNFKDLLQEFVVLEDGRPPSVCILDRNDNIPFIQSRFKSSEEAMERSTYMFLFITQEFVNDSWAEVQKDECLMESIRHPDKKWCVVPLHTQKKKDLEFRYPYGLRALKGVDISIILPGKNLETLDVKKLKREEIDHYFLQNIARMFNQRIRYKIQRERAQELKLRKWIQDEQQRKMKAMLERQHKEKIEEMRRQQEIKNKKKALEKDLEKARDNLDKMPLSTEDSGLEKSQPSQNSIKPADRMKQLISLGISFDEAINILKMEQAQQAKTPAAGGAGGAVYNIHNYGNVQIGQHNVQQNKPANLGEGNGDDVEDSGVEVEEVSDIPGPNGEPSVQHNGRTLSHVTPDGAPGSGANVIDDQRNPSTRQPGQVQGQTPYRDITGSEAAFDDSESSITGIKARHRPHGSPFSVSQNTRENTAVFYTSGAPSGKQDQGQPHLPQGGHSDENSRPCAVTNSENEQKTSLNLDLISDTPTS